MLRPGGSQIVQAPLFKASMISNKHLTAGTMILFLSICEHIYICHPDPEKSVLRVLELPSAHSLL